MKREKLLSLSLLICLFTSCVFDAPTARRGKAGQQDQDELSSTTNSTGNNTNSGTNPPPPNPTPTLPPINQGSAGENFFNGTVKPMFEANCMSCHTLPFNNPPVPGPLTLYDYAPMKAHLMNGSSNTQNQLMNKARSIVFHTGGNRCPGGVTDPICATISSWWDLESGTTGGGGNPPPPPNITTPTGDVLDITALGKITGWAANPMNTSEAVVVKFYVDGAMGGAGNLIGQITASNAGFNGGYAGNHAFTFYLPVTYRDGQNHTLYVYASSGGQDYLLSETPWTFSAYNTSAEGFNYYNNTIRPLLEVQCMGCHAVQYDIHFNNLLDPTPNAGGTALNNQLINMASGSHNGVNHPGGNICGNKNTPPCSYFQQWWNIEFGQ